MKKFVKNYYYILLPICISVFMMLLCNLYFATVDDLYMEEIANSNANGRENLVCLSALYGYLFKALYSLAPNVNWFTVCYVAVLNIAMMTMYKIVKDNDSPIYGVGILAAIQAYLMIRMTFTALSFISCVSAVMWIMHKVTKLTKKSVLYFVEAFLLFCMGFAMRGGSVFTCIMLLFVPFYLFAILEHRNKITVVVTLMLVCIVSHLLIGRINESMKASIPEETYFNQFHKYRSAVSDQGYVDYDNHAEMLNKVGISQNDVFLYAKTMYADKSVFSMEALEVMKDAKDINDKYTLDILYLSKNMVKMAFIWWYLAAMLISLILMQKNYKEIIAVSVFVMGAIFYLFLRRRGVARVVNQISIAGIIMLLSIAMREFKGKYSFKDLKKYKLMAVGLVCIFGLNIAVAWAYDIITARPMLRNAAPVLDYINENNENVYVCNAATRSSFINRELTFSRKAVEHKPIYNINGNWYVYTDYWYFTLEQLGLQQYEDSTFNTLLEPNVKYIASESDERFMDYIVKFLDEHYNIDAYYKVEKEFDNSSLRVYSFEENNNMS